MMIELPEGITGTVTLQVKEDGRIVAFDADALDSTLDLTIEDWQALWSDIGYELRKP